MEENLKYKLALTLIPKVGNANARKLISYFGSAKAIFDTSYRELKQIPGLSEQFARYITQDDYITKAEKELEFIKNHDITPLFFLDENYPERLKHCPDAPVVLYVKGNADLNPPKILSVVGTRNCTQYGIDNCNNLIDGLADRNHNITIVSGLAYGIDICAHRAALRNNLPTIAAFGHGFDRVYPSSHRKDAVNIIEQNGGLITEYMSKSIYDSRKFLQRNRIIAGIADAVVVVESGIKGGALVTADIANSYSRDVFAFPGRIDDEYSLGCNKLIKHNKAAIIENVEDMEYFMNWNPAEEPQKPRQRVLFQELSEEEKTVGKILKEGGKLPIDTISLQANMPMSQVSSLLLNLEFTGIVRNLPGKYFELAADIDV